MKVYYSHSMKLYGTKIEQEEIKIIEKNFPDAEIINPPSFERNPRKRIEGMVFCHRLIDECDAVVFSRLMGVTTSGVGDEVNYALKKNKKVFEIKDNSCLVPHYQPLKYITRKQTVRIYRIIDRDANLKRKIVDNL